MEKLAIQLVGPLAAGANYRNDQGLVLPVLPPAKPEYDNTHQQELSNAVTKLFRLVEALAGVTKSIITTAHAGAGTTRGFGTTLTLRDTTVVLQY